MLKKLLIVNCSLLIAVAPCAQLDAAITIKKAAPVAAAATSGTSTSNTASLVGTVMGLVSGIQDLNKKQNALSADCVPSSSDMAFVEKTMKEYAKTGAKTADELKNSTELKGRDRCSSKDGCYAGQVLVAGNAAGANIPFDAFVGDADTGMIWYNYPKPGKGHYCTDGTQNCKGSARVDVSDIYDIFNLIDFEPADYLPTEATQAAKLLSKVENCSASKLSAKKKEMWGSFLVNTAGNLGQPTNTGTIMQQVQSMAGGGTLGTLGAMATQMMAK